MGLSEEYYNDLNLAMNAFIACCDVLKLPFNIKHAHKVYGSSIGTCTVTIAGKSFTKRHDNCLIDSIKEATYYLIRTYTALEQFRKVLEEKCAEKHKIGESIFQFVKYTDNEFP